MEREVVIPFDQAMANRQAPCARWPEIAPEFGSDVLPVVSSSFRLAAGDEVFTIGSCFARNIEAHLARLGCRIPMLGFDLPAEEWHGFPNQALNKFHPPSFRQALDWAAAIHDRDGEVSWEDCEAFAIDCGDGDFFDLDLLAVTTVSRERFIERRRQIYAVMRTAFSADCVIMTPGVIEAWRDRRTGLFTAAAALKNRKLMAQGERFELVLLDYDRCLDDLAAAIAVVRERNPDCRVLLTTSPVPMAVTFTGWDVRTANTYSKSVLRAVCGALAVRTSGVDYFPSYESVTLSDPARVWRPDRIHVEDAFIGRMIERMAETYFPALAPALRSRQRAATALAGGDLETAEREARAALAADPQDVSSRMVLVDVLLKRGEAAAAVAELDALPEAQRSTAATGLRLAQAVGANDAVRGAELAVRACALPDADRGNFMLADRALARIGAPADARETLLREGVRRLPLQPSLRKALAGLLEGDGRPDEAIAELRAAAELPYGAAAVQADLDRLLGAKSGAAAGSDGG